MESKKKIIISVGRFTDQDIIDRLENDNLCYIEAYDPLEKVYQKYLKIAEKYPKRFVPSNNAVSAEFGESYLYAKTTKSTICPINTDVVIDKDHLKNVSVVSMQSILERFDRIDELHINCEGSEIPIVMETDLSLFEKCDFIFIQFHTFIPFLSITQEDMLKCIEKLKSKFTAKKIHKHDWAFKKFVE